MARKIPSEKTIAKRAKRTGKQEKRKINKAIKKGESARNARIRKAKKQMGEVE